MNGEVLTYLPYPDFYRSVSVLDDDLLDEQRLGTVWLLESLLFERPWEDDVWEPTADMWRGYEISLFHLQMAISGEWRLRGLDEDEDTLSRSGAIMVEGELARYVTRHEDGRLIVAISAKEDPPWFGDSAIHRSHRAALVRHNPGYYRRYFPNVNEDAPLVFPEFL
jgi:hypothetical protein